MVSLLKPRPGARLLEPCAGEGAFIDAVLSSTPSLLIDAFELDPDASQHLLQKYKNNESVSIFHSDTLVDESLLLRMSMGGYYDLIISNPPYGAWQEYDKRKELKKIYRGLYVKETYALFLYQALQLLKPGGRLVFIVPDTFLSLHMHRALRRNILLQSCIETITLFPSSFFPGVNFGYSNLSIISLKRMESSQHNEDNQFTVSSGYREPSELLTKPPHIKQTIFHQRDLLESIDHSLLLSQNADHLTLLKAATGRLGDIADCVTGIYSGNDKQFLRVLTSDIRNGAKYQTVSQEMIYRGKEPPSHHGIATRDCFVPILKGGGVRFHKPNLWFLDWSVEAVHHYQTNQKARFQNSRYYFKTGIGVPMVSSSSVTAALIEQRIFDQSIVGIFPHEPKYLYYLLGFFNSTLCTTLLRTINPSANNSANYIKKLPFLVPTDEHLNRVNTHVRTILSQLTKTGGCAASDIEFLNREFESAYNLKQTAVDIQWGNSLTSRSS
jgi:phospholipid N-methyltransferase